MMSRFQKTFLLFLIFSTGIIFIFDVSLIIFNTGLLINMIDSTPELMKLKDGLITSEELSSIAKEQLLFLIPCKTMSIFITCRVQQIGFFVLVSIGTPVFLVFLILLNIYSKI